MATTPKVSYKTITPEEAHLMLRESKRKNVPVKKRKIDRYARDMIDGKWDENNSQGISRDTDGNIVNGHQRLMACIQAGKPFRTLFIDGVPPGTFMNEDTGRSRDAGHFFAVLGEKFYFELASAARCAYLWDRGQWNAASQGGTGLLEVTYENLKDEVDRRPTLRKGAEYSANHYPAIAGRFNKGLIGCLYAMTLGHDKHEAFWTELIDRANSSKESPAWKLNRRIDNAKAEQTTISRPTLQALLVKAWNAYVIGEDKGLVWNGRTENMPQPITEWVPELVPKEKDKELIVTSPPKVKRPRPSDGPPQLRVVPKPEKKAKTKKAPKLRGGIGS